MSFAVHREKVKLVLLTRAHKHTVKTVALGPRTGADPIKE